MGVSFELSARILRVLAFKSSRGAPRESRERRSLEQTCERIIRSQPAWIGQIWEFPLQCHRPLRPKCIFTPIARPCTLPEKYRYRNRCSSAYTRIAGAIREPEVIVESRFEKRWPDHADGLLLLSLQANEYDQSNIKVD